ncbi:hypothetical protein RSAG8_03964, partial [Rhizoctonia solani AG-8 WAC10335]
MRFSVPSTTSLGHNRPWPLLRKTMEGPLIMPTTMPTSL